MQQVTSQSLALYHHTIAEMREMLRPGGIYQIANTNPKLMKLLDEMEILLEEAAENSRTLTRDIQYFKEEIIMADGGGGGK